MTIKDFFFISLSVGILFLCTVGGFYIWKSESNRAKRDLWYTCKWQIHFQDRKNNQNMTFDSDKIKKEMLNDGYKYAEIADIACKGLVKSVSK